MAIFCLHCFTLSALSSVELRYLYSTDVKRCRCFSFFVACRCFISHIDREIHQTAVSITTKKICFFSVERQWVCCRIFFSLKDIFRLQKLHNLRLCLVRVCCEDFALVIIQQFGSFFYEIWHENRDKKIKKSNKYWVTTSTVISELNKLAC